MRREDADYVRGKARTIVINSTYRLAPWADLLYACDAKWWDWNPTAATEFTGMKFAMDQRSARHQGVQIIQNGGVSGLSKIPTHLRNGHNSGYQVLNLAFLMGVSRIVLLGYDMQPGPNGETHWHGDHKSPTPLSIVVPRWLKHFETVAKELAAAGVNVINCTRETALTCFERQPLEAVL